MTFLSLFGLPVVGFGRDLEEINLIPSRTFLSTPKLSMFKGKPTKDPKQKKNPEQSPEFFVIQRLLKLKSPISGQGKHT